MCVNTHICHRRRCQISAFQNNQSSAFQNSKMTNFARSKTTPFPKNGHALTCTLDNAAREAPWRRDGDCATRPSLHSERSTGPPRSEWGRHPHCWAQQSIPCWSCRSLIQDAHTASICTQQAFTHSKLLHTASIYTAIIYTQQAFTPSKLLHREAFTNRSFHTQEAFTLSSQSLIHGTCCGQ